MAPYTKFLATIVASSIVFMGCAMDESGDPEREDVRVEALSNEDVTASAASAASDEEMATDEEAVADFQSEALLTRQFSAYAPPFIWGPWVQIAAHGGVITYGINYSAVGDTLVLGRVEYYSAAGWRTDIFRDSITITTGDAWATVKVSFYGNPFGSAVYGTINP